MEAAGAAASVLTQSRSSSAADRAGLLAVCGGFCQQFAAPHHDCVCTVPACRLCFSPFVSLLSSHELATLLQDSLGVCVRVCALFVVIVMSCCDLALAPFHCLCFLSVSYSLCRPLFLSVHHVNSPNYSPLPYSRRHSSILLFPLLKNPSPFPSYMQSNPMVSSPPP